MSGELIGRLAVDRDNRLKGYILFVDFRKAIDGQPAVRSLLYSCWPRDPRSSSRKEEFIFLRTGVMFQPLIRAGVRKHTGHLPSIFLLVHHNGSLSFISR